MALNTFKDVQNLLDAFVAQNNLPISGAPHGAFWQTSYQSFVTGNVPGIQNPETGQAVPILVKGDGAHSNLIYALSGTPGTPWGPDGDFGQMPPGGPFLPQAQIDELSAWISQGCPQ
ncbi:hypothetical protein D3X12_18250 [Pseudomonas protegens]|jgi:hypothetical protein|uniref:Uncharacterized protein n=3 Tax=Pseudomonas protegens TaxID=380021 RepID=Q4KDD1_PSEF5|nr:MULTISPECIES: hypothetical protein [Pseudomonas]GED74129.1 hypothetical protein PFL02_09790 [Pseudomonas fluorescens]AAY91918.1 conserved hypothetical protein [Pseudomonas protegens Pf-5]AGL84483.1 hypothetical protein PFLCHA0_c27120 [Pseudomonas protegens CHA0]AQT09529.1 hypothetical protein H78_02860 [Pseudomonas protegens]ASE23846.1 hypothetical protein CEP86_26580 [Pseudomonas protegens]